MVPHPSLLFNLGQVNRLGGNEAVALQFYRKFIAVSASGDLAEDAKRYIAALEAKLGDIPFEDPLKPKVEPKPEPQPDPIAKPEPAPIVPAAPPRDEGSPTMRIAGLASAGVGLALVGGGVYFGLRAKSLSDELSEISMEAWTEAEIKKDQDGRDAERNMIILTAVGGTAIVAGTVLYFLGRGSGESSVSAALAPTASGAEIVVSGRF